MEQKEFYARQHKALENFYKELFKNTLTPVGYWIVTGVMLFCACIFLVIPYQVLVSEGDFPLWTVAMMGAMASVCYASPYDRYQDGKGFLKITYGIIMYLPISARIVSEYQWKRLLRFQTKVYLITQAGQLFFSLVCFHEVVWASLWYPLVFALLWPLLAAGALVWMKAVN